MRLHGVLSLMVMLNRLNILAPSRLRYSDRARKLNRGVKEVNCVSNNYHLPPMLVCAELGDKKHAIINDDLILHMAMCFTTLPFLFLCLCLVRKLHRFYLEALLICMPSVTC